jgi:cinnamoyl-CoA:phenyllactate CoA-transferase
MNLAAGVMVALLTAKLTGRGDKVSVNLLHSSIFAQSIFIQAAQYTDIGQHYPISRKTADNPGNNVYKCADERFIQLSTPQFDMYYPRLMTVIGREDLVGNPRYTIDNITENKLHTEFIDIVDEAMLKKPSHEWTRLFTEADIPHSLCQVWEEVLDDKQAWAIGAFEKVAYPTGERTMVRTPVTIDGADKLPYEKAPLLGEHSEEIIKQLGYTEAQLKEMHEKGVYSVWEDVKEACKG